MRPQLLNPEVYRISSFFGQMVQRSHSSGSLRDIKHPSKSQSATFSAQESASEPDSGPKSTIECAAASDQNSPGGSVIALMKEQSYYEEMVSLAKHPSKPRPLLQFYHSRLHEAVREASPNDGKERLEYMLPDALACSRKLAVTFVVPPASELPRRAFLEAFKWRRVLLEDEWVMIPSLNEEEAAAVITAAAAANVTTRDEMASVESTNSPKKQLTARTEPSPLLRLPSFGLSAAVDTDIKLGRLRVFMWRLLDVAGLSLTCSTTP